MHFAFYHTDVEIEAKLSYTPMVCWVAKRRMARKTKRYTPFLWCSCSTVPAKKKMLQTTKTTRAASSWRRFLQREEQAKRKTTIRKKKIKTEDENVLRGVWSDRDTNDIFAHCSLIFYFLDFKFSNFVCPSELHPLIWFFWKHSFRKKKNIQKPPKTP